MSERKLLGEKLNTEETILLAQLTTMPGWVILVRLMAEACRDATETVIKLDPQAERYQEKLTALQTTARAMHKFSADVLDSVKVHQRNAVRESNQEAEEVGGRFKGFKMPQQSPK